MRPMKEKISISLDEDVIKTVRAWAEWEDRSLSSYINLVLKRHIAEKKKAETPNDG